MNNRKQKKETAATVRKKAAPDKIPLRAALLRVYNELVTTARSSIQKSVTLRNKFYHKSVSFVIGFETPVVLKGIRMDSRIIFQFEAADPRSRVNQSVIVIRGDGVSGKTLSRVTFPNVKQAKESIIDIIHSLSL